MKEHLSIDPHYNQLSPAQAERLALLAEECGELVQAVGKALRHGYAEYSPFDVYKTTNRDAIEHEVADVYVALRMMFDAGDLRRLAVASREEIKTENVRKYLHHQEPK